MPQLKMLLKYGNGPEKELADFYIEEDYEDSNKLLQLRTRIKTWMDNLEIENEGDIISTDIPSKVTLLKDLCSIVGYSTYKEKTPAEKIADYIFNQLNDDALVYEKMDMALNASFLVNPDKIARIKNFKDWLIEAVTKNMKP